jgi:TPR repeat protein
MYATGTGVEPDFKEAERWIRSSAMNGFAEAQFMLGGLYFEGKGVPQSNVKAYAWWVVAFDSGSMAAYQAIQKVEKEWDPKIIEKGKMEAAIITLELWGEEL